MRDLAICDLGAERETMYLIYPAVVRVVLDNGCIFYGSIAWKKCITDFVSLTLFLSFQILTCYPLWLSACLWCVASVSHVSRSLQQAFQPLFSCQCDSLILSACSWLPAYVLSQQSLGKDLSFLKPFFWSESWIESRTCGFSCNTKNVAGITLKEKLSMWDRQSK